MDQLYIYNMVSMAQFSADMTAGNSTSAEKTEASEFDKLFDQITNEQEPESKPMEKAEKPQDKDTAADEAEVTDAKTTEEEQETNDALMQEYAMTQIVVPEARPVEMVEAAADDVQAAVPVMESAQVQPMQQTATEAEAPVLNAEGQQTAEALVQPATADSGAGQTTLNAGAQEGKATETGIEVKVKNTDTSEVEGEETQLFKDVEAAPIKVAEAPTETKGAREVVETKSVETQVETKLTSAIENGETTVEIRLEPENLGTVNVEITRSSDGTISVLLNAESGHTQALLKECSRSLEALLSNNGQQNVEVTVPREEAPQQGESRYGDLPDGREEGRNGRQQERRQEQPSGEDFMHQLRLGLIPLEEVS